MRFLQHQVYSVLLLIYPSIKGGAEHSTPPFIIRIPCERSTLVGFRYDEKKKAMIIPRLLPFALKLPQAEALQRKRHCNA